MAKPFIVVNYQHSVLSCHDTLAEAREGARRAAQQYANNVAQLTDGQKVATIYQAIEEAYAIAVPIATRQYLAPSPAPGKLV